MTRELFVSMLATRGTADGTTYTFANDSLVDVLIAGASGGPTPIPKIASISLEDAFVVLTGEENEYILPYEVLVGLKLTKRGEATTSRTGFRS
jgi:hypothetical protein